MTKLSDAQLVVLNTACQRDDRCVFPVTLKLKGNAVGNVLKSLLTKGLVEEVPATIDDTVWRHDDGAKLTLRATDAAMATLGIDGEDATTDETTAEAEAPPAETPAAPRRQRDNTKQARLIAMLRQPDGATVEEIVTALGWQPHTVRGAIAGALKKKLGLNVTSEKVEPRGRVYRIV